LGDLAVAFQLRGKGVVNTIGIFAGKISADLNLSTLLRHTSPGGAILNDDGSPSAVVHQYDRFQWIFQEDSSGVPTVNFTATRSRIGIVG